MLLKSTSISRVLTLSFLALLAWSCKNSTNPSAKEDASHVQKSIADISDDVMASAVIYEANIRQYSPEGTFDALTKDIPVLKELGTKILWLMPIHPISSFRRKATSELFTYEIPEIRDRHKYLGSYYSIADYKDINPEFGTLQDFEQLIEVAHQHGIYVIIDWVPNHTGWDHPWIFEHTDWYTQNEKGQIIDPLNPETGESWGWTDVADLNYNNPAMRNEMIADMAYWVDSVGIDGFRVDVAHGVPTDFFETAIRQLEKNKPLFMLAEAEKPELFRAGFDMQYAWKGHHLLNDIAKGDADATDFKDYMEMEQKLLQDEDFSMNFVTNHDENSWNGTLSERMPDNKELFTALTYLMPGMPLIYSGQEYDLDHRLKFFEKDSIPKDKSEYFDLLVKLGQLKNSSTALHGSKNAADFSYFSTDPNIIAFNRSKRGETISFIGNVSSSEQKLVNLSAGKYKDYMTGEIVEVTASGIELGPWGYKILIAQ